MVDVSQIFNGADDLFKFMVIGGAFLIVFSLMYPLEKEKELKLKMNDHNSILISIEHQDSILVKKYNQANKELDLYFDSAQTYLEQGNIQQANRIKKIVDKLSIDVKTAHEKSNKAKMQTDAQKREIEILEHYFSKYSSYSKWMLCSGVTIGLIGLLLWFYSQVLTLQNKRFDTQKNKVARNKAIKEL